MNTTDQAKAEALAKHRYAIMNLVRIGGLGLVLLGIVIARNIVPLPYPLGVVLAVAGLLGFFIAPTLLARRWKAADRVAQDHKQP